MHPLITVNMSCKSDKEICNGLVSMVFTSVTIKKVWLPDRQTHAHTDRRRTKWSLCAAMLCRRHKIVRCHNCLIRGVYITNTIHKRDYQESVTTGQTDARTHRQTPDKVIPMCRYASQATQKANQSQWQLRYIHIGICIAFEGPNRNSTKTNIDGT